VQDKAKNVRKEGFCFMLTVTQADNSQFMDDTLKLKCNDVKAGDMVFPISWDGSVDRIWNVDSTPKGFCNLYFVNEDHVPISFTLEVTQRSRGVRRNTLTFKHKQTHDVFKHKHTKYQFTLSNTLINKRTIQTRTHKLLNFTLKFTSYLQL
jgi:hypothetical protein